MKIRTAAVVLSALFLAACGGSKEQTKTEESDQGAATSLSPVQTESDGNSAIERIDVNNDQKPDVFKYYRLVEEAAPAGDKAQPGVKQQKKVLIRKEMDVNFDQRIDIVEFYTGDAGKEVKQREEMDLDFDGRVDATYHYKDGNVTLVEEDLGFDGKVDTWKYYQMTQGEDGKPVNRLVERRKDTNGDGNADVWEYYTKGSLARVGTDTNGDGTPDQFTRVDEKR